ncbi:hypothetical protein ABPG72_001396 [Tetrahymena utriculariae]
MASNSNKIVILQGEKYQYQLNLENVIGRGAISEIFIGSVNNQENQTVAIKVLRNKKLDSNQQNNYLEREYKFCQEIKKNQDLDEKQDKLNPNVLRIFECLDYRANIQQISCQSSKINFNDNENRLNDLRQEKYIITEYCNSKNLFDYAASKGFSLQSEALDISLQIAKGLKFLQDLKIMHRDLKPENILVHQVKEGMYIFKIGDFGIVNNFDQEGIEQSFVGTLNYMSPELINKQNYTQEIDYWSLGCIIYEIFNGYQMFCGFTEKEVAEKIRKFRFQNFQLTQNQPLNKIILKCMLSYQKEGYKHIDQIITELQNLQKQQQQKQQFQYNQPIQQLQQQQQQEKLQFQQQQKLPQQQQFQQNLQFQQLQQNQQQEKQQFEQYQKQQQEQQFQQNQPSQQSQQQDQQGALEFEQQQKQRQEQQFQQNYPSQQSFQQNQQEIQEFEQQQKQLQEQQFQQHYPSQQSCQQNQQEILEFEQQQKQRQEQQFQKQQQPFFNFQKSAFNKQCQSKIKNQQVINNIPIEPNIKCENYQESYNKNNLISYRTQNNSFTAVQENQNNLKGKSNKSYPQEKQQKDLNTSAMGFHNQQFQKTQQSSSNNSNPQFNDNLSNQNNSIQKNEQQQKQKQSFRFFDQKSKLKDNNQKDQQNINNSNVRQNYLKQSNQEQNNKQEQSNINTVFVQKEQNLRGNSCNNQHVKVTKPQHIDQQGQAIKKIEARSISQNRQYFN